MEVDQTSALASKPGPSTAVNLDLPHPRTGTTSNTMEEMELDYGLALPPHLGSKQHHQNVLDQHSSLAESPFKVDLVRPKKHSHSQKA